MITLVLGGARSGKSAAAEALCARLPTPVTYVATGGPLAGGDDDWAARVAAHRARRPAGWYTVEVGPGSDLVAVLDGTSGTVLLDALGTWMAGHPGFAVDGDGLVAALRGRAGDTVVVSDEVGMGVHPSTEAGRRFRDALGRLNQQVAAAADDVFLVVAGRLLPLLAVEP
jgi:adenosylcobinamide kinase/adenosylcobinamide-phosphate guanylyltransferase